MNITAEKFIITFKVKMDIYYRNIYYKYYS